MPIGLILWPLATLSSLSLFADVFPRDISFPDIASIAIRCCVKSTNGQSRFSSGSYSDSPRLTSSAQSTSTHWIQDFTTRHVIRV